MMRTFETSKGDRVETNLTDDEAAEVCRALPSDFARSLARQHFGRFQSHRPLSPRQLPWLHFLAVEAVRKAEREAEAKARRREAAPSTAALGDFAPVFALFSLAKGAGLKFPKIHLQIAGVGNIKLSVAGPKSRYAGEVMVTDEGRYPDNTFYGSINHRGSFMTSSQCGQALVEALREFAEDPSGFAQKQGHMTSRCCFCRKDLDDPRSVAVGYGPVCADHYGLPWTPAEVSAALAAKLTKMMGDDTTFDWRPNETIPEDVMCA